MCRVLVCCESSGLIMCVKAVWVQRLPLQDEDKEEEETLRGSDQINFFSRHGKCLDRMMC